MGVTPEAGVVAVHLRPPPPAGAKIGRLTGEHDEVREKFRVAYLLQSSFLVPLVTMYRRFLFL